MESHHPSNQFKLIPLKTPGPQMPTILYEGVRMLSSTAEMNISEMKTHMCDDGGIRSHTDFVFLLFDRTDIWPHMCF